MERVHVVWLIRGCRSVVKDIILGVGGEVRKPFFQDRMHWKETRAADRLTRVAMVSSGPSFQMRGETQRLQCSTSNKADIAAQCLEAFGIRREEILPGSAGGCGAHDTSTVQNLWLSCPPEKGRSF